MTVERRYVELRADAEGRVLRGTAVTYGDVASLPFGRERIEAGAFAPIGDVILNASHDRTARLPARPAPGSTWPTLPSAWRSPRRCQKPVLPTTCLRSFARASCAAPVSRCA